MTRLFDHPYASFLHEVAKPNRYTGAEHGARRKAWDEVEARVCLAFPEIYDIGMSHLGYRILYKTLNDDARTLAERAYAPWVDMEQKLIEHGKLLCSLESARPLCDFDVVGFSLQYELTYTTILNMLQLGGIPLRARHRSDDDPLILAGGPVATHAEPFAPFLDALLIGDGEEATTQVAVTWARGKREGKSRHERLLELAQIRGVYVPAFYSTISDENTGLEVVAGPGRDARGEPLPVAFPVERALVDDLRRFPFPDDGPVGGPEAIFDRMSIEVARGCTEGCRFCQAGMIYRPVRERDPKEVVDTVLSALEKSGQDEVSLTALSTADVSCISPLIKELVEKTAPERVSLGVASLRAYGLGEDLLDAMRKVRASGLTFAPEAGTQRMRDVINKNVTEAQLLETAERVFSRGFDKMKLYFICGLPTETEEDVRGIVDVGKNALAVGKRVGKRPKVTVSVSVHVPKPHTPFQWCAMDTPQQIADKQQLLRDETRGVKGLTLRMHHSPSSVLEGVLARGDRRLADVIEHAFAHGARFDTWEEHLNMGAWQAAFESQGLDMASYLGTFPVSARLPWDHVNVGLEPDFLAREYRRALKDRLSPPCGKPKGMFVHHTNVADASSDSRKLVCYDCGVACDLTQMRQERIVYLRRMGAEEAPGAPSPAEPTDAPAKPDRPRRPEDFRPLRQGTEARYRLRFEKTGPAALLGHLDLIRELPRVLRRAGARTVYSQGFHPKPAMTFGPALSLGIASLDEHLDCKLLDAPEPDELRQRLDAAAAGGLRFTGATRLGNDDPGLSRIVNGARYVIALAESALSDLGGRQGVQAAIDAFLAKDQVVVRRTIKGIGKNVNVRHFVTELRLGDETAHAVLARAGVVGNLLPLAVAMQFDASGAAKISEVVQAVFGSEAPHVAVRSALLAGGHAPMDLERHRKGPKAFVPLAEPQAEADSTTAE
ncbi:MAG: TIGR03960 family B12-binding radical SAM protein [Polyangiaceae bacterium]